MGSSTRESIYRRGARSSPAEPGRAAAPRGQGLYRRRRGSERYLQWLRRRSSRHRPMPKFPETGRIFEPCSELEPQAYRTKRTMTDEIRRILRDNGRLSVDVDSLGNDADLYQAGMTSHASVNVMLALEDAFDVEFPDSMLKRSVFESIAAIEAAGGELQAGVAS